LFISTLLNGQLAIIIIPKSFLGLIEENAQQRDNIPQQQGFNGIKTITPAAQNNISNPITSHLQIPLHIPSANCQGAQCAAPRIKEKYLFNHA